MQKFVTEAIVLKNLNYGDSHKFYSLLTKDHGKISALAMGVRKISSRRAGNLDSLNHIVVSITESSKGFKTVNEVKTLNSYKRSKESLDAIYYGLKFAESVEYSLDQDHDQPEIFYLLLTALDSLDQPGIPAKIIELWFLLGLSDALGFKIDLKNCAGCGLVFIPPYDKLSYSYESGGILCGSCSGYSLKMRAETFELLRSLRNNSLESITSQNYSDNAVNEVSAILNTHARNMFISRNVGEKTGMLIGNI
ncbi:DNA repair protein RecO [candidate division WWE3 bacterium]|uniref:DNA repair protein RecO n=1 Tax=candidate division WWE3 bacterium TaxID=2053526 RepID=A0A7X9DJL3_UNCKA|nr:DNA repair protein RecO [candidate division WWE3 bacterium]